jgi:hypothetical protein
MLAQFGVEALQPTLVNGRYHGPMVKPRVAALVKKRAVIEGTVGSFCPQFGGWLEEWDNQRKVFMPRVPKGHIRERNRERRADKITRAMAEQPKKLAAHQADVVSRRPDRGPLYRFRDMAGGDIADGTEEENPFIAAKKKAMAGGKQGKGGKKK